MRRVAVIAIVLACAAAGAASRAAAQALVPYAAVTQATPSDETARLFERDTFEPAGGLVRWNSGEHAFAHKNGAVDSLRVSVGGVLASPAGLPLRLRPTDFEARAYDVAVLREWPDAVSLASGKVALKVSPHAGVGMTSLGGSAEAGARMELSRAREDKAVQKLKDMGVGDGAQFGDRGRWYLYAAASGRAVGMNMLRGEGGWNKAGWTTDPASTLISDAQVGVGWRKGVVQTSFGAVHREVKGEHMIFGQQTRDDTLVALSLSIKPRN